MGSSRESREVSHQVQYLEKSNSDFWKKYGYFGNLKDWHFFVSKVDLVMPNSFRVQLVFVRDPQNPYFTILPFSGVFLSFLKNGDFATNLQKNLILSLLERYFNF